jgi:hypothetical protein
MIQEAERERLERRRGKIRRNPKYV